MHVGHRKQEWEEPWRLLSLITEALQGRLLSSRVLNEEELDGLL